MLKLLIAEDLDLVAEAFVALLNTEPEFEVVARVNRGDRVVEAAREHRPDIALLDVVMPGLTGIEACRQLRQALPDCKVMLLTSIPRSGHLATALAAGSSAYLPKTSTAEQLVEAIHTVAGGGVVLDPAIAAEALVAGPNPLTDRERDTLRLVHQGLRTSQIAEELFLSSGTVRNYLASATDKLGARNRTDAAIIAGERGWL